jgi:uncharacterized integral membrane protein
MMQYFVWPMRAVLFLMLLGFAVKNDQPVVLKYFFGFEWQTSLVVILLCFFSIGVLIGVVAMLGNMFRLRRELAELQRFVQLKNKLDGREDA